MRTNIEIDDNLMQEAMRAGPFKTKRAAVEAGLRALAKMKDDAGIKDPWGTVQWEGNLGESRLGRFTDWSDGDR